MDPIRPISPRDRDIERIARSERVAPRREREQGDSPSKRRGQQQQPQEPDGPEPERGGIDVRV